MRVLHLPFICSIRNELTTEILHEFIDKVVVHHRQQIDGQTVQKVEIYYKIVGKVEIPNMSKKEKEKYLKLFGSDKQRKNFLKLV